MNIDTVTKVTQSVHNLLASKPLVNCIVNDALVHAMPNVQQTVFHPVNIMHPQLTHLLLDDVANPAVDWTEVDDIWWP